MVALFSSLLSLLGGGATGFLGAALQRFADYKTEKMKAEHEIAMKEADAKIMAQEWAAKAQVVALEGEAKVEVEDSKAFAESLTSEPKRYSEGLKAGKFARAMMFLLDFIRGSIRPALTIYLAGITTVLFLEVREMSPTVPVDLASELYTKVVNAILYLTTTCILWWFGTRSRAGK